MLAGINCHHDAGLKAASTDVMAGLQTAVVTCTHAVQAAVVGLSCRHDVMELLEKRVRSRFSHRKELVPEMEEKHFDQPGNSPKDVLAAMLTLPDSDCSAAQAAGPVQQWNSAVSQVLSTDAVVQQLKLMLNQGSRSCLQLQ